MDVKTQIEQFEGRKYEAYPDPITHGAPLTIGVGHCGPEVHPGLVWTDEQIDAALTADIDRATEQCRATFEWFGRLNEPRQAALVGMAFQMGLSRLQKFVQMLGACRDERWAVAAEQMRQSVWARQTAKRAIRLAAQMESGEWA